MTASAKTKKVQKKAKYSRVLLKLSGESLGDANGVGIGPEAVHRMAEQICEVRELGVLDVGVEVHPAVEEEPVFGAVA